VAAIERPARLSDLAAEHLRDRILSGTYPPGSQLSQEALAREFSISRTPLRDALKLLERDGLVELDETGSASVIDIPADDARDLMRIRETIDGVAARRAAALPDGAREALAAELGPITYELADAARAEDPYRFRLADSRFHVAVIRHCASKQLINCKGFVHATVMSVHSSRTPGPGHLTRAADDHVRIAAAVLAGDSDLSARLARGHVHDAYEHYFGDQPASGHE
jgi:DNA-binding GntR family transcriptional regulator